MANSLASRTIPRGDRPDSRLSPTAPRSAPAPPREVGVCLVAAGFLAAFRGAGCSCDVLDERVCCILLPLFLTRSLMISRQLFGRTDATAAPALSIVVLEDDRGKMFVEQCNGGELSFGSSLSPPMFIGWRRSPLSPSTAPLHSSNARPDQQPRLSLLTTCLSTSHRHTYKFPSPAERTTIHLVDLR